MKIGTVLPLFSGDARKVLDAARESEELGFDGAFAFDHLFPPGAPSDRPSLEAFSTLAAVAAATERIALGTLVARASLRPVGMLAKTAAWLDAISGGRCILGIGTGDAIDRPEHETFGIPMLDRTDRRAHLEETVEALTALFAGRPYPGGRHVPRIEGPIVPPPVQAGGPQIWLGGLADPVLRIAGRRAGGWNGWGLDPKVFRAKVEVLREAAGERAVVPTWAGIVLVGRDEAEAQELLARRRERGMADEAWVGTSEQLVALLSGLRDAGAGWAVLVAAGPADRRRVIAEEVMTVL